MEGYHVMGRRIAGLRKAKGYTQENLSALLNVSPQAISKWEQGNSFPDIGLLAPLAKVFEISIDKLLTGSEFMEKISPYDAMYGEKEFYWGLRQSSLAERAVKLLRGSKARGGSVLDLGAGEGRDSVYFAKSGLLVDALEISAPGVEKIRGYSEIAGCEINLLHENLLAYTIAKSYDLIYSMGTLQFLPPKERETHFAAYKRNTAAGGWNAHLIFVEKPFVKTAPDWQSNEFFYTSGDLARYYRDWEIVFEEEMIVECSSAGIAHQHAVNQILARKPAAQ